MGKAFRFHEDQVGYHSSDIVWLFGCFLRVPRPCEILRTAFEDPPPLAPPLPLLVEFLMSTKDGGHVVSLRTAVPARVGRRL